MSLADPLLCAPLTGPACFDLRFPCPTPTRRCHPWSPTPTGARAHASAGARRLSGARTDVIEQNRAEPVGDLGTYFDRLRQRAGGGSVLAGFDFPIGLPRRYAANAGLSDFRSALAGFGHGRWRDFYQPAETEAPPVFLDTD